MSKNKKKQNKDATDWWCSNDDAAPKLAGNEIV